LKARRYYRLVEERKGCRRCAGLINPSVYVEGAFDSREIGPWSRWQGDLDADLMVVGQDWGDTRYFERNRGLEKAGNPTNQSLEELLASIGIQVGPPEAPKSGAKVFLTNAILCLKSGGLQGPVHSDWFTKCGQAFLKPQIELIRPKAVVALGQRAYNAILTAYGLSESKSFRAAAESDGTQLGARTRLFAVYHPGLRIQRTHRPRQVQLRDWERIGTYLRRSVPPADQ